MKINIWETAPTMYPYARRKWDRHIFKTVSAELPGRDETDILAVVDEVYTELAKIEVRGARGEASIAALVRTVAQRRAWKTLRRWQAEGYRTPFQPLGPRHPAGDDSVAREAPTIGTTGDGSDDEASDPINENSWGDWSGDPARIYEKAQEPPVPVTQEELTKKYGLTAEEVELLLSDGPKSGRDRVRLSRLRERMKKKLLGENQNK